MKCLYLLEVNLKDRGIQEDYFTYRQNGESRAHEIFGFSYELVNHLGNVLEVITDRKLAVDDGIGEVDYYVADVVSQSDYYPFGMMLNNTNFDPSDGSIIGEDNDYRYGFQGQEKDDEIKGGNKSVNYKYRMHDPRVGRFFAVDPLTASYPMLTPYQFSHNRVMDYVEIEGMEGHHYMLGTNVGDQHLTLMYVDHSYNGKTRLFIHHMDKKSWWIPVEGFVTDEYEEVLEIAGDDIEQGDFEEAFKNVNGTWFSNTLEDRESRKRSDSKTVDNVTDVVVIAKIVGPSMSKPKAATVKAQTTNKTAQTQNNATSKPGAQKAGATTPKSVKTAPVSGAKTEVKPSTTIKATKSAVKNTAKASSNGTAKPIKTQWGWSGAKVWKNMVDKVRSGGTIQKFGGKIATKSEAIKLIEESGGVVNRIEGPHTSPNPHNYNHINYTTSSGNKGTIRIQDL